MRWLAIHLPEIAAQVFCRGDPLDQPLAVCESARRAVVVARNRVAGRHGIAPGERLASALALAPGLIVRDRLPQAEAALLEELAGWAYQFSSCVSVDGPDCVVLEIAGSLRLFGGIDRLGERVAQGLTELGLEAGLACAPTPLAARWLARLAAPVESGATQPSSDKARSGAPKKPKATQIAAQTIAPYQRGRAVTQQPAAPAPPASQAQIDSRPIAIQIAEHDLAPTLAALPLAALAAEGAPLELLSRLGCRSVGDCLRLPRVGLSRRGARDFNLQLDRALGRIPDPRPAYSPPLHFSARIELPMATDRDDMLMFASRRLFARLVAELAIRFCAIEHFTLLLEHEDLEPTRLTIHLGSASRDETRFALLTREHLAARALPAPACALSVEARDFLDWQAPTARLFGDPTEGREAREVLLARLRARLGSDAVVKLELAADHRPERACRHGDPAPRRTPSPPTTPRPLWLLERPLRFASGATSPWSDLTAIRGPERIEAGWWDQAEARRDYYIARDKNGALLWIFQDLQTPHDWYVHGIFS